jgi:bifunctional oligoribonuclease and PAP phosphatase NrnA
MQKIKKPSKSPMILEEIRQAIQHADRIGITAHIRPDGDAVGSVIALGLALQTSGKQVQMVLRDGVSNTFRHLQGSELVRQKFEEDCDLYIALDSSDLIRLGGVLREHSADICIDHHITNENYAKLNLIRPEAVATCAILAEIIPQLGLIVDLPVANALLTGILSDSIGFRTSNTNAESLRLAADLMDKGANINVLYNKALISRPFEATKYWGYALQKLERSDGLVWTSLTLEDRKNAGYPGNDDADLTNILSSIDPLDVVVLFVEQKANLVKVSWRARPGLDISGIAHSLGGGGHPAAAGVEITGTLQNVSQKVLQITADYLKTVKEETIGVNRGTPGGG